MQLRYKKQTFIFFVLFFIFNINVFSEPISDITQLYGRWKSHSYSISFPVKIRNINYFKVESNIEDITNDWYNICETRGITVKESLTIKDVIISEIFNKDFPLANELGVNEGVKISYNTKLKKPKIKAQRVILIPENVINENLECFDIADNRLQMKDSICFSNSLIDDFIIEEKLRRKGSF